MLWRSYYVWAVNDSYYVWAVNDAIFFSNTLGWFIPNMVIGYCDEYDIGFHSLEFAG